MAGNDQEQRHEGNPTEGPQGEHPSPGDVDPENPPPLQMATPEEADLADRLAHGELEESETKADPTS